MFIHQTLDAEQGIKFLSFMQKGVRTAGFHIFKTPFENAAQRNSLSPNNFRDLIKMTFSQNHSVLQPWQQF